MLFTPLSSRHYWQGRCARRRNPTLIAGCTLVSTFQVRFLMFLCVWLILIYMRVFNYHLIVNFTFWARRLKACIIIESLLVPTAQATSDIVFSQDLFRDTRSIKNSICDPEIEFNLNIPRTFCYCLVHCPSWYCKFDCWSLTWWALCSVYFQHVLVEYLQHLWRMETEWTSVSHLRT